MGGVVNGNFFFTRPPFILASPIQYQMYASRDKERSAYLLRGKIKRPINKGASNPLEVTARKRNPGTSRKS